MVLKTKTNQSLLWFELQAGQFLSETMQVTSVYSINYAYIYKLINYLINLRCIDKLIFRFVLTYF